MALVVHQAAPVMAGAKCRGGARLPRPRRLPLSLTLLHLRGSICGGEGAFSGVHLPLVGSGECESRVANRTPDRSPYEGGAMQLRLARQPGSKARTGRNALSLQWVGCRVGAAVTRPGEL